MNCKYCNSDNIIKFGTYTDTEGTGIQRYYCKECKRKFVADTLPDMHTPTKQITSALRMYYGGMALDAIQGFLQQEFGNKVAESTIYNWIIRFTKKAIKLSKNFIPDVGDLWLADETGIDVYKHSRDLWYWDIIDSQSRFLLASHISVSRTVEDAETLIEKAIQRAGKYPKTIMTDKLPAYIEGISYSSGNKSIEHIQSKPFVHKNSTNKIERFHGTFKDRMKVVRAFKNIETARILTDGWLIYYNFFKQHEALGNVPPAVKMNKPLPFRDWTDVVNLPDIAEPEPLFKPIRRPLTDEEKHKEYFRLSMRASREKEKQNDKRTLVRRNNHK